MLQKIEARIAHPLPEDESWFIYHNQDMGEDIDVIRLAQRPT
jgi:hypothetical protein